MELNKLAASVLLAGIIAMVSGVVADVLYHPEGENAKRGFSVAVAEEAPAGADAAAAAGPVDIASYLAAADVAAGQAFSKKCSACHNFEKGAGSKVGPELFGVAGRAIASFPGFAYSDAMKAKGGNWTDQHLSDFLEKPKAFVPGTKMVFAGIKKPEDRANLIAYLKTLK